MLNTLEIGDARADRPTVEAQQNNAKKTGMVSLRPPHPLPTSFLIFPHPQSGQDPSIAQALMTKACGFPRTPNLQQVRLPIDIYIYVSTVISARSRDSIE